jgi:hypothetical protein
MTSFPNFTRRSRVNEKSRGERRSWRCPEETAIAAYVQSRLSPRDKDRLEAHLADCDFCLSHVASLARAQEITAFDPVPDWLLRKAQAMGVESAAHGRAPSLRWAIAGSLALALTGALWFYPPSGTEDFPGGASSSEVRIVRGESGMPLEILYPQEGGVVSADEVEFRWATAESALFYEVSLVTADGDLVWQSRIEQTQARLPPEVRLIPKEKYYVWVRAQFSEGGAVKSKTIAFEISVGP